VTESPPSPTAASEPPKAWYRKLHWQVLVALVLAVPVGLFVPEAWVGWYDWMGQLFLKLLEMVVVPLIVSSIVVGIARIGDPREVGRLGGRTLVYYVVTSALAILTGLVMVNLIKPGVGVDLGLPADAHVKTGEARSILQLLLDMVPVNPLGEMASFGLESGGGGAGMVGVIFFAVLFGMATASLEPKRRDALLDFFDAVFAVMMTITNVVIRLTPFAVFSLLAVVLARTGADVVVPMLGYMLTVIAALGVHFFVTVPLLIRFLGGRSPWVYMKQVGLALTTAFTTASSNATLPVSLEVAEKKAGIDNKVGGFVIPLGATVNMDGSALYEGVAALFVAQVYGIHLGLGDQALIFVTALLASIGAAGIPHASLVMMAVVFDAVGLPLDAIGLLLGVDRVLTMCRTATNVWGDLAGAAVISGLEERSKRREEAGS
jgi:proton glutamate symport protein